MDERLLTELKTAATRAGLDVSVLLANHEQKAAALIAEYRQAVPGAAGGIAEFRFSTSGNVRRRLLRREIGAVQSSPRGTVVSRNALSFGFLTYYAVRNTLTAVECGAQLADWRIVLSPISN